MNNKIVLLTLHTRRAQHSLALKYFEIISRELSFSPYLIENDINVSTSEIIEEITKINPIVLAISLYIWNREKIENILLELKAKFTENFKPIILLGGPEVLGDGENIKKELNADYLIRGEGELEFKRFLIAIKDGKEFVENREIHFVPLNDVPNINGDFIKEGLSFVYYESSRGCPSRCSFCLSSRFGKVRVKEINRIRTELSSLYSSGFKRSIRFIDRTFNYPNLRIIEILKMLEKENLKFEMVQFEIDPRLLDDITIEFLGKYNFLEVQLEIGVQSLNENELIKVGRKQNSNLVLNNIKNLLKGNVNCHLDLIYGFPHQDLLSYSNSLDKLLEMRPMSIQSWSLKILPGTKLRRECVNLGIRYNKKPPYNLIETDWLKKDEIEKLELCNLLLNRIYNLKRFRETLFKLKKKYGTFLKVLLIIVDTMREKNIKIRGVTPTKLGKILFDISERDEEILSSLFHEIRLNKGKAGNMPFSAGENFSRKNYKNVNSQVEIVKYPFSPSDRGKIYIYSYVTKMKKIKDWVIEIDEFFLEFIGKYNYGDRIPEDYKNVLEKYFVFEK